MKDINSLGISPWPWRNRRTFIEGNVVEATFSSSDEIVVDIKRVSVEDALLIASAPELYEALSAFVNWYEKNKPLPYEENGIQMIAHYAKQALAKASGESEVEK